MMKKITLMMFAFIGFALNAQVVHYSEDFNTEIVGQEPTGYTILNEDTCTVNTPSVFTNEAWIVSDAAGDAQGNHVAAQSWTNPSCQVDDWLITPAIDLTTASPTVQLSWKGRSFEGPTYPETYEVRISTTGTNVTDFLITLTTVNGEDENWASHNISLTPYIGSTVYIAYRLISNDMSQLWLDDIKVYEPAQYDNQIVGVSTSAVSQSNPIMNGSYIVLDFSERDNFAADVEIINNGLLPTDSLYLTYALVDDIGAPTLGMIFGDTVYLNTPLAPGATYTHTFETFGLDTLFPGMGTSTTLDFYVQIDSSFYNRDLTDEDFIYELLIAPPVSFEVTSGTPYTSSFEIADLNAQQFVFDHKNWGWKYLDNNNDDNSFVVASFSNLPAQDLDFQVFGSVVNGNQLSAGATNDFFQSPNLTLEAGATYSISIWARTGFGATGQIAVRLTNSDGSYSSNLGNIALVAADSTYTQYSFTAPITTDADDYLVNFEKTTPGFILLDNFEIALLEPPTASINLLNSSIDEPGVNYCDSSVTVNYSTTGSPTTVTLNWGDGTVETVTGGTSSTHQYTVYGQYDIVITASNAVGSAEDSVALSFEAAPAPTLTLSAPVVTGTTATFAIGDDILDQIQYAPSCSRVIINWGDNTTNEVTGQNSANHTYANVDSTYTITVTIISSAGQVVETVNVTIVYSSINNINLSSLSVYPNPSNTKLSVAFDLDKTQNVDITVYTVTGNKVATQNFNTNNVNTNFNTSNFNEGVYILKIETEQGVKTQKFVVKH